MTFFVASAVALTLPIPVPGTGDNIMTAQQSALHAARVLKRIERPVVLSDREAARANFLWAQEEARRRVRIGLDGSTNPSHERQQFPLYDER